MDFKRGRENVFSRGFRGKWRWVKESNWAPVAIIGKGEVQRVGGGEGEAVG